MIILVWVDQKHYYTAKQSYRGRAKTMRQIYYLVQEKLYEGTAPDYYVGLTYEDYLRKQRDLRDGTAGAYPSNKYGQMSGQTLQTIDR